MTSSPTHDPWRQTNEIIDFLYLLLIDISSDAFQQPIRSLHFPKIFPKIFRRFSEDSLDQSEARKSVTSSSENLVARVPQYY